MATNLHKFRHSNFKFYVNIYRYCVLICMFLTINRECSAFSQNQQWLDPSNHHAGRINLRNIDLEIDPSKRKIGGFSAASDSSNSDDGEYFTDTRQEAVNPADMGGVIIQQASQDLSARLRWLSNDEIGITNMQVLNFKIRIY